MYSHLAWTLFADMPPKPPGFKVGEFEVRGNYAFWLMAGVVAASLIGAVVLVLIWLIRRRKK